MRSFNIFSGLHPGLFHPTLKTMYFLTRSSFHFFAVLSISIASSSDFSLTLETIYQRLLKPCPAYAYKRPSSALTVARHAGEQAARRESRRWGRSEDQGHGRGCRSSSRAARPWSTERGASMLQVRSLLAWAQQPAAALQWERSSKDCCLNLCRMKQIYWRAF